MLAQIAFSLTPGGRSKRRSSDCIADPFFSARCVLVFDSGRIDVVASFLSIFVDLVCLCAGSSLSTCWPRRRNSRRAAISLVALISIVVFVPFLS
uniref:hypothetical protein n=1 Tax=Synechococcus sp. UW106 TaxID=368495 RepID=UPI001FCAC8D9|nr:hypothetical protein [Synechococcus sp. UW106]